MRNPNTPPNTPVVLCFSGLDPTGGAGIQADIEAIGHLGGHAAPVITANTIQDTHSAYDFTSVDEDFILRQARCLLKDMPVSAIKIGMLGTPDVAQAIGQLLDEHPDIPVIFDPILFSGNGGKLSKGSLIEAVRQHILPHCNVITPNTIEARLLSQQENSTGEAAQALNKLGADYVLLTGTHEDSPDVQHRLFHQLQCIKHYPYPRLSGEYHGSGCTLTSGLAALIASGVPCEQACQQALDYTYESLKRARSIGGGQLIPRRYK